MPKRWISYRDLKTLKQARRENYNWPYSKYGRAHYLRGAAETTASFGANYATANETQRARRTALGYQGRGLYTGGGFYKGFGGDLGQWIGNKVGLGGLGRALGEAGANYTGFGEYEPGNDTMSGQDPIPSFGSGDQQGDTCITYREYVCDIYGPENTSFGNQVFPLNPGLEGTFPFLSQIAENYEEYEIKQLLFHFRSSIAPIGASNTGQVGEVIMSTNYNASSEPYTDKQTMLSAALSMSGRVTQNQNHGVECDPAKLSGTPGKYVRSGPIPQDEDLKSYDHGLLNVAVAGIPSEYTNQPVGQLWVAYTVVLRKPKKFSSLGWGISRDVFCNLSRNGLSLTNASPLLLTDNPSNPNNGLLEAQQNRIGCRVSSAGSGSGDTIITIPAAFSGTLKVRLITSTAQNTYIYGATCGGNVIPIHDIFIANPNSGSFGFGNLNQGNWTWMVQGAYGDGAISGDGHIPGGMSFLEVHIRVSLATGGVDNTLVITSGEGGTELGTVLQSVLEIEEYNTSFDYKQDGTNDRIQLVDNTGTIVNL